MGLFNGLVVYIAKELLPYGPIGLFVYSFLESSIFPFPNEVLMIPLMLASSSAKQILFLALIAVIASVAGGMFGYYIGHLGKKAILERFFSKKTIGEVHKLYNKYEVWAVFIGGFTPFPFKLITISAGAFYINFKKFILVATFARGLRFFLEAVLIIYFGKQILSFLDKHFGWVTLALTILFIGMYWFYKKRFK